MVISQLSPGVVPNRVGTSGSVHSAWAQENLPSLPQADLMPFDATVKAPRGIPFAFADYLELVDWTGILVGSDKRGVIGQDQPAIIHRSGIDGEAFVLHASRLLKEFGSAVGAPPALARLCAYRERRFLHGMGWRRRVFGAGESASGLCFPPTQGLRNLNLR